MADFLALEELTAADLNSHFTAVTPLFVRKTADESVISSATLQNDNHLFLSVAANTTYELTLRLIANSATTADIQFLFTFPAGLTMNLHSLEASGAGASNALFTGPFDQTSTRAISTTGSDQIITMSGLVMVSATAGTLQLQWSQFVSIASNTTVKTNSYMILRKVA